MSIKQLEEQHEKLMAEAEKLGAQIASMKSDGWPKDGDRYSYISSQGLVNTYLWGEESFDRGCAEIGNIYRTEDEALKEVDRRKVLTKLKARAKGFVPDWCGSGANWYIQYAHNKGKFSPSSVSYGQSFEPYFASEADAQAAIDELGDELMALL